MITIFGDDFRLEGTSRFGDLFPQLGCGNLIKQLKKPFYQISGQYTLYRGHGFGLCRFVCHSPKCANSVTGVLQAPFSHR